MSAYQSIKIVRLLFIHAILLSNLLSVTKPAPSISNGCVAAGLTNCCTLDTCVTQHGCYCDRGCYDTNDCCDDIQLTCPPSDGGEEDFPTEPPGRRPPRITLAPEDNVTVSTDEPLTMTVVYDRGFPLSTLVWRKDGEIITSRKNPGVTIMTNGGISIRSVKSSDRGLYTITVSNTAGSDNASFKLFIEFASLIETGFRGSSFYCEARGYPTAHFVRWIAMNGSSITDDEWASFHLERAEFESTMTASLPLHAVNCTVGGISCVFDNGNEEYQVESPMMDCPTVIEVGFEESEYRISEQAANSEYATLEVCLKQIDEQVTLVAEPITVTIATQGGTAIMGSDFMSVSINRTFTLPLHKLQICECVNIVQDDVTEVDEVFYFVLSSPNPQVRTTGAVVHIVDDDSVTAILDRTEYYVSENDGCVEVCVTLVGRYQRSVTVYLCIEGITAIADEDYVGHNTALPLTFQTSTLVSPEMQGKACASMMLINDTIVEGNETFRVTLQEDPEDTSVIIRDQSSATVTIIDDDRRPLTATFINNTPKISNTTVTINFQLDSSSTDEMISLRCKFSGPGRTPPLIIEDCFSGAVVTELPPRKQEYNFTLEGIVRAPGREEVTLLERDFRLDLDVCWLHLVNQGVVVNGGSATFEWQPSGPFAKHKSSSFWCMKDLSRERENCSSPYIWNDLSPGEHRLIVEPYQTPGCRRLLSRAINFVISAEH